MYFLLYSVFVSMPCFVLQFKVTKNYKNQLKQNRMKRTITLLLFWTGFMQQSVFISCIFSYNYRQAFLIMKNNHKKRNFVYFCYLLDGDLHYTSEGIITIKRIYSLFWLCYTSVISNQNTMWIHRFLYIFVSWFYFHIS